MLLRFVVSNHLSIRDRQELSLVASALSDAEDGLIHCSSSPSGFVLPAIVIYGANASGKSNIVDGMHTMRAMVLESHRSGEPAAGVANRQHFRLDAESAASPSHFEVDFVLGGARHHYGFEVTDQAFAGEWLFDYPSGRRRLLFERDGGEFRFGRALKGRNRFLADLTRENSLFLSAAAQNGHDSLTPVFSYFQNMRGIGGQTVSGSLASDMLANDELDQRMFDFLDQADTGVVNYRLVEQAMNERQREVRSKVAALGFHTRPERWSRVELAHRGSHEEVYFELERESAGTRRLLLILNRLFESLDAGTPLVVDELDLSLHTEAALALLDLFCSRGTNPNGAQLIATVHDTNLLRGPMLRRDQVWFSEKEHGATRTYPLTDIRTRKGDNLERGYLQHRFGGTPRRLRDGPSTTVQAA